PRHALALGGPCLRVRARDPEGTRTVTRDRSDGPMTKLEITSPQLNRYLWTRQGFDPTDEPRPAAAVIDATPGTYGGAPSCYLSILARSPSAGLAELDGLLYTQRSVVR